MIEPAQTEVQAAHVLILPCGCDSLVDGRNCFTKTSKVRLQYRHMEESVLIMNFISRLHGIVIVTVKVIKCGCVIACSPCIEKSRYRLVSILHKSDMPTHFTRCDCLKTVPDGPAMLRSCSFMSSGSRQPSPLEYQQEDHGR